MGGHILGHDQVIMGIIKRVLICMVHDLARFQLAAYLLFCFQPVLIGITSNIGKVMILTHVLNAVAVIGDRATLEIVFSLCGGHKLVALGITGCGRYRSLGWSYR